MFGGYDGTNFFGSNNGEFVLLDYDGGEWVVPEDNSPPGIAPEGRAGVTGIDQVQTT